MISVARLPSPCKLSFWKYTAYLLRCCAQINPQRIKDTPAVNLCSRLVSIPYIFKRLTERVQLLRAAHKLILNVAEAARMPLVLNSNQFACKLAAQKWTRMFILGVPAGVFCTLLASSERTGMSVKLSSSEFAPQTRRWTVYTEVHCSTGYFKRLTERLVLTDGIF